MEHYWQPAGSNSCGQYCVAMVADITPEESILLFKSSGRTRAKELAEVLRKLGFNPADRLKRFKDPSELPEVCIVRIKWDLRHGHWLVYNKGIAYDPAHGIFPFSMEAIKHLEGKATSYLKIQS